MSERPMSSRDPERTLSVCARGSMSLAEARGVSGDALVAARELCRMALSSGRDQQVRTMLLGLLALDEFDLFSRAQLTRLALDRGDLPEARDLAEAGLRLHPESAEAGFWMVRVLFAERRYAEARGQLFELLDLSLTSDARDKLQALAAWIDRVDPG